LLTSALDGAEWSDHVPPTLSKVLKWRGSSNHLEETKITQNVKRTVPSRTGIKLHMQEQQPTTQDGGRGMKRKERMNRKKKENNVYPIY